MYNLLINMSIVENNFMKKNSGLRSQYSEYEKKKDPEYVIIM